MCAAPGRPVVICLNALRSTRGMSAPASSTAFHLVRGLNKACWSSSVSAYLPRADTDISEVKHSTGMEDSFASTMPGRM